MTAPVYLASFDLEAEGSFVMLDGPEGHHAATVRRTRVGERIDLVNGQGVRLACEVTGVEKKSVTLLVIERTQEPAPRQRITLVQALAKGGRDEQAVETSTEYGVFRVIPWASERAIVSWKSKEEKGRARWSATALSAAKQSRRSWVPEVLDVHTTAQLIERAAREQATLLVCHEEATGSLTQAGVETATNLWIVVGPEGGITADELAAFELAGASVAFLAPHVLRSASAGPYAIAALAGIAAAAR